MFVVVSSIVDGNDAGDGAGCDENVSQQLILRDRVTQELIETERSYVHHLKLLLDHYVDPIEQSIIAPLSPPLQPNEPTVNIGITADDITMPMESIFEMVRQLHFSHSTILNAMAENQRHNPAQVLLEKGGFFKM